MVVSIARVCWTSRFGPGSPFNLPVRRSVGSWRGLAPIWMETSRWFEDSDRYAFRPMKLVPLFTTAVASAILPLSGEEPIPPLAEEEAVIRAWEIEDVYKAASADKKLHATLVAETAGHTYNAIRLVATFWDSAPVEGDYGHTTTYDLGRVGGLEPPVRIEKLEDRLYRLSYKASVSDTFESVTLGFFYDLHLAEDGALSRVVPVHGFVSFWEMDGSKMGLVASGSDRSIYYVKPKTGSNVAPGTLFFHGTTDGKSYRGRILNWGWDRVGGSPAMDPDGWAHDAVGEIEDDGNRVVIEAKPVDLQDGKMVPTGEKKSYVLNFKSLAGSGVSLRFGI